MRIELTLSAWKAEVLPLNYIREKNWSGRRDSNSRPSPWQGDALPLSHFRIIIGRGRWIRTTESSANGFTVRPLWPLGNPSKSMKFVEAGGGNLQPLRVCRSAPPLSVGLNLSLFESPPDFLITLEPFRVRFPLVLYLLGAGGGNRTPNLLITNQLLYR